MPPLVLRAVAACAAVVLALSIASSAFGSSPVHSRNVWATINVCDTAAHPDTIGVRASMAGTGSRGQRMYIRITLDYFDRDAQDWKPVGDAGDSKRFYVGASTHRVRQGGMSFAFQPPSDGSVLLLRGNVRFEWRRGRRVIYHTQQVTTDGHAEVGQADPAGFSAATCEIRA